MNKDERILIAEELFKLVKKIEKASPGIDPAYISYIILGICSSFIADSLGVNSLIKFQKESLKK